MRNLIRRAFTRTVKVQKRGRTQEFEVQPSQKLVYGVSFAIVALICLTILEATYMLVFHSFSTEIFSAIMLVVGTILGAFFGSKV